MIPNVCHTLFPLSDKTINSHISIDYTDNDTINSNTPTPVEL